MPPRVLFVESGESGGGSFHSLAGILEAIDKEAVSPVVAYLNDGPFADRAEKIGLPVFILRDRLYSTGVSFKLRWNLARISLALAAVNCSSHIAFLKMVHNPLVGSLDKICREREIDLVYLNGQINRDYFGVLLAQRTGLPVVSHLHSMHGRGFCRLKAESANRAVASFAANSRATADYWVSKGLDENKVRVVPNAVSQPEGPGKDPRDEFGLEPGAPVVGCVGRLIELKGHEFLIRSFALLLKKVPQAVLLIIGDGPMEKRLKELAEKLEISGRVVFAGRRENAPELMGGMDVLVLPSKYEGSGRVLIEAMVRGTPVIGTDLYGIREIIGHGTDGFLVPYGDEEKLAGFMDNLLLDDDFASNMGRAGARKAVEEYSMDRLAQNVAALINEALQEESGKG